MMIPFLFKINTNDKGEMFSEKCLKPCCITTLNQLVKCFENMNLHFILLICQ